MVVHNSTNIPSVSGTAVVGTGTGFSTVAYTASDTDSTIVARDLNGNSTFVNIIVATASTVSSGQTINLNSASTGYQLATGSSTIKYVLPDATTLYFGQTYQFNNNSSGNITVYLHDGSTLFATVVPGAYINCLNTSNLSANGVWDARYSMPSNAQYGTSGLSVTGYLESSTLTANAPVIANGSNQLTSTALANGQLLIGYSGTVPSAATLSEANGINVANSTGSITLSNLRDGARYVVSGTSGQAGYTTIGAAITQAVSDGVSSTSPATILVWPGTYTENVTLKDYVNIASIGNGVTISGNMTYPSGSGIVYLTNVSLTASNSSPTLSLTCAATINANYCTIASVSSTAAAFYSTTSGSTINCIGSSFSALTANIISSTDTTLNFYSCSFNGSGTASTLAGGCVAFYEGCNIIDFYTLSGDANFDLYYNSINAGSNSFANVGSTASATMVGNVIASTVSSNYLVTGTGGFFYSDLVASSNATLVNSALTVTALPNLTGNIVSAGTLITNPGISGGTSLVIGTGYQNTIGYDVTMTVYLSVTAATSASISCGVGTTSTPLQQTIVASFTTATQHIIPIPVYLPNNYYVLISTSGTITATISGQQFTAV